MLQVNVASAYNISYNTKRSPGRFFILLPTLMLRAKIILYLSHELNKTTYEEDDRIEPSGIRFP